MKDDGCARATVKKMALFPVGKRRPECADDQCPYKFVVEDDQIIDVLPADVRGWKVVVTYDFGSRTTFCPACALRKYPEAAREQKLLTRLRALEAHQISER